MSNSNTISNTLNAEQQFYRTRPRFGRLGRWLDHEQHLGYLMVAPAMLVLVLLVAYPFVLSIWLGFTDTVIGKAESGAFIGFENYLDLLDSSKFRNMIIPNTILYTIGAVPIKLLLGLLLALLLNRPFPLRSLVRGLLLIPWVLPTSLSMVIFSWMFHPTLSVYNAILETAGIEPIAWFAKRDTALLSVMFVNIWRGTPFFAVLLLAALQSVPADQVEAAEIDGAGRWQRFRHVVIPTIFPVIVVATLFSIVRTAAEMEIVWVLTRGAPRDGTHMIGTYAYQAVVQDQALGEGAAISLFFFPLLAPVMFFQLWYLQRREV